MYCMYTCWGHLGLWTTHVGRLSWTPELLMNECTKFVRIRTGNRIVANFASKLYFHCGLCKRSVHRLRQVFCSGILVRGYYNLFGFFGCAVDYFMLLSVLEYLLFDMGCVIGFCMHTLVESIFFWSWCLLIPLARDVKYIYIYICFYSLTCMHGVLNLRYSRTSRWVDYFFLCVQLFAERRRAA